VNTVVSSSCVTGFASTGDVVEANRGTIGIHITSTIVGRTQNVRGRRYTVVSIASVTGFASTGDVVEANRRTIGIHITTTIVGSA